MVLNATFNNISVIPWRSVSLEEETEVPEKTTDLQQGDSKLYNIMLYRAHLTCAGFELTTLVVIGTDYIGSLKSNYHTITTTTAHCCKEGLVITLKLIHNIFGTQKLLFV
jgi:hypothetical protein